VLSFGGMGIVYQIVFEVTTRFWIKEYRYLEPWTKLREQLISGKFMQKVNSNDFVAFRANPHQIKGDHLCSIVVQNIIDEPPSNWEKGRRNIISTFVSNREALIEGLIRTINRKPEKTGKKIQTSLKYSRVKNFTHKSYKVLYQSGAAVLRYGISSEFAFTADAQKIVDVLERIFAETARSASLFNRYHPSHIPVRFVMPSNVYLSSAYHRPTMYIDVPTLYSALGYQDLLEDYQIIMMAMGGIPHWGKVNNMMYLNPAFIDMNYPKVQTFRNVRQQMDPNGTFSSDFIRKMGL
jgi:hypothetical protein